MSPRRSDVEQYLARIGYRGSVEPTFDTLAGLQRAHLRTIPYENLDIHLGRRLPLGADHAFEKLVIRERGGWCYEMNGLFGWVLETLGFTVRLVSGAVGREQHGDLVQGNHLVALVDLGRLTLADVGFGDGPLDPLPLVEGVHRSGAFEFRLQQSSDRWILHNHEHGGAPSFDFTTNPVPLASFAEKCLELQTSPTSGFVQKTVCQRYDGDVVWTLRGAVLRRVDGTGVTERVISDRADYERVLRDRFGLAIPEVDQLWPVVWRRHLEWQESLAAAQSSPSSAASSSSK
jgi:N-hydroxyarylamine O-acetyltransferase